VAEPTGIPSSQVISQVAQAEALLEGRIPPIPPGQLQAILAKLRKDLTEKP